MSPRAQTCEDLAGRVFGRWTVLYYLSHPKNREARWRCRCECGTERDVRGGSLKNGTSRSCGCLTIDSSKSRYNDLTSLRFGRLVAKERVVKEHSRNSFWKCLCDCGNGAVVRSDALVEGKTVSCGCYNKELHTIHGESHTRLFRTHYNMMLRCYESKTIGYHNYGGRGIIVCDEWHDYLTFRKWAMENGYGEDLEIDRIDNDEGYYPDNCRWVTILEQGANKRNVHRVTFQGKTQTISEWSEETGINRGTLKTRLYRLLWPVEKALIVRGRKNKGE